MLLKIEVIHVKAGGKVAEIIELENGGPRMMEISCVFCLGTFLT